MSADALTPYFTKLSPHMALKYKLNTPCVLFANELALTSKPFPCSFDDEFWLSTVSRNGIKIEYISACCYRVIQYIACSHMSNKIIEIILNIWYKYVTWSICFWTFANVYYHFEFLLTVILDFKQNKAWFSAAVIRWIKVMLLLRGNIRQSSHFVASLYGSYLVEPRDPEYSQRVEMVSPAYSGQMVLCNIMQNHSTWGSKSEFKWKFLRELFDPLWPSWCWGWIFSRTVTVQ